MIPDQTPLGVVSKAVQKPLVLGGIVFKDDWKSLRVVPKANQDPLGVVSRVYIYNTDKWQAKTILRELEKNLRRLKRNLTNYNHW